MFADVLIYLLALTASTGGGWYLWRRVSMASQILIVLLSLTLLSEFLTHISGMPAAPRMVMYIIYTPLSFSMYVWIYHLLLRGNFNQRLTTFFFLVVLIAGIGAPLFVTSFVQFPSLGISICSLVVVVCSLLLFAQMLQSPEDVALTQQPVFWLNTALLIYWTVFFFRHALYDVMVTDSPEQTTLLDDIHLWLSVFYYATLGYSIKLDAGRRSPAAKHLQ
ncbi:MAG: hypothetical protein SH856_08080 [Flavobacteriales bacterium]|nr:hypothetical protein [Flavobacteriales bacterium]